MGEQDARPAILFVDDEPTAVKYFERVIGSITPVIVAGSVEEARCMLDAHAGSLKVLVSDQRMPGEYGNVLLSYASERYPHIVRILTTAYSELDDTVQAINMGQIHRYIRKPWDVRSLRMEMTQALGLATLIGERDGLLREKIGIGHRYMLMSRIGAVRAIGMMTGMSDAFDPADAYFSAAATVGLSRMEPDWNMLDYADLIALEAERTGRFGQATRVALEKLHAAGVDAGGLTLSHLHEVLGDAVEPATGDAIVVCDTSVLTQFLDGGPQASICCEASGWLAFLIWAAQHGTTVQTACEDGKAQCRLVPAHAAGRAGNLAAWAEAL